MRVSRAVALASVVLALLVPSTALAANTAKFTSVTPKAGSSSLAPAPTVSVVVYDKYGVKGASRYSMSIDGVTVKATLSYVKGFGYKKFKLVYKPKPVLSVGKHSIRVNVRDLKAKRSSYAWTYTVRTPPAAVEMPVTVAASSCLSCHAGFPAAHPMTECAGCHSANSAPRPEGSVYIGQPMSIYGPGSTSAHTAGCASSPTSHCHASLFPHNLDTDCTRCHNAAFPLTPQQHSIATTEGTHTSRNTFCAQAGCHLASLTKEHYRHTDDSGATLTCTTCHSSKDLFVAGAILDGSTDCETCHHFATHPGTETKHALPALDCVSVKCHGGAGVSLASIHAKSDLGCAACHRPLVTLTATCTACHPPAHNLPVAHAATLTSAAIAINGTSYGTHRCSECHTVLDLRTIHGDDCTTCHTSRVRGMLGGAWAHGCAQGDCHTSASTAPLHGKVGTAHTLSAVPSCVVANCHTGGTDVAKIHGAAGGPGCAACHTAGKTSTLVCATAGCHPGGAPSTHNLAVAHAATPASAAIVIGGVTYGTHACSECHVSLDLRTVHGDSCAACHAAGVHAVLGGAWTRACVQGGCHVTTSGAMKAVHGSVTASHTLATTPSCIGAGCHTGGKSVAAIHSVVPKRTDNGCGICHIAGKTPTLVCSNTGCHATGATPIHSSHPSTVTADVITINGVSYGSRRCADCHTSLELQAIHGGASSCAKCHSAPAGSVPKGSFTCALGGCHVTASGAMKAQHGSINASHTLATTPSCVTTGCHTGGASGRDVAAIHGVVGGPGCAACHGSGKTPTLVCVTCHPTYPAGSGAHASHPSTQAAAVIAINGVAYGSHTCSECHTSLELQTIHGGTSSCVKCHPSPAGTAAKLTYTCAQGGCHITKSGNMLAQHGSINASHTVSTTPSCIAVGCHIGGKDVAAIHAVAGGPGCAACHGSGKTPTLVCITCHPTYPASSAKHTSHPATVTAAPISVNGAAYGSFSCSLCHASVELQTIHGGTGSCVKCHPNPALTVTSGTFDCSQAGCHVTKSGPMLAQHGSVNASHTVAVTPSCIAAGCHVGGKDVAAIHAVAGGPGCTACHGGGKVPSLNCVTCHPTYPAGSGAHASHPSTVSAGPISINGTGYGSFSCSLCHASLELQAIHGGTNSCAKCHPSPAGTAGKLSYTCALAGCHVTKSGNMLAQHGSINASHTVSTTPGCIAVGCHIGGKDVAAIHGAPGGPGCTACHGGGKVPTLVCVTCHPTYPAASAAHASHPSTVSAGPISINGTGYGSFSCSLCHPVVELQTIHGGTSSCTKCHPNPASTVTSGTYDCSQAGCHVTKSGAMLAQHGSVNASHTVPTTPSCIADECHTGGTDVAAIHGVLGGPGCTACHGGGKSPSLECTLCHSSLDHITVHEVTDRADSCLECHAGTNLTTIHASCKTCHRSGDLAVKTAISEHSKLCSACHDLQNPHPNVGPKHVSSESTGTPVMSPHGTNGFGNYDRNLDPGYVGFRGLKCVYCHWQGDLTVIHKGTCATCHRGADPVASLNGAWNGTCQQGACHPDETHPYYAGNHWIQWTMFWHKADHRTLANGVIQYGDTTHVGLVAASCQQCHSVPIQDRCKQCHSAGVDLSATHTASPPSQTLTIAGVNMGTHACVECHVDRDLETIHMDANTDTIPWATYYCRKCHGDSWLVYDDGVQRRAPAWLIDTWDKSCTQGVCHTIGVGNMSTQHENIDATHTLPAVASCSVAGCHQDASGGRNIAVIHSTLANRTDHGCGICHGVGKTPTVVCATCHGAGTYHANAAARHAVSGGCTGARCHQTDVSTIHSRTGCPACHSGAGATTTSCVECHPDATITTHVNTHADCLTCHPKVKAFSHDFYQYMPTINASADCGAAGCHAAAAGTVGAFRSGGFRHTWVRFNGQDTTCLMDCHGYQDYQYWRDNYLHGLWYDKIAPTTTAHVHGPYVGDATIDLTATDSGEYSPGGSGVGHTYYRIDAASALEGTTVVIAAPSSGSAVHTLYFHSVDHCGNVESETSVQVVVLAR